MYVFANFAANRTYPQSIVTKLLFLKMILKKETTFHMHLFGFRFTREMAYSAACVGTLTTALALTSTGGGSLQDSYQNPTHREQSKFKL